jgi:DNA-binding response OmpR family regulator
LTRELLLQQLGHRVFSAEGFAQAYEECSSKDRKFDLILLGHSIPRKDKKAIIAHCQQTCKCPVLALLRPPQPPIEEATLCIESGDPAALMTAIRQLLPE